MPQSLLRHQAKFVARSLGLLLAFAGAWSAAAADAPTAEPAALAADGPEFCDVPASGEAHFYPTDREPQVPEKFRLAHHAIPFEARFVRQHAATRVFRVTFPSPIVTDVPENNRVHAEYFQPAGNGMHPACVVLHILGGDFLLSRTIANHLAQNGVAALFVKMPYYGERRSPSSPRRMITRDPAESVAGMTQGVLDIRRAAAWLASRPEVDARRLGISGISLGGIMSALAGAVEPQFSNVAIHLAGGNLGEIVWAVDHAEAAEFRRRWLADGGTKASFLEQFTPIDPVTYGRRLANRRVLLVAAKNDEIIPPACTEALWASIGTQPELVWLDAGHYTAIRFLPREIVRLRLFFQHSRASEPEVVPAAAK